MSTPWLIATGANCIVLRNSETGVWIGLDQPSWFSFSSGSGASGASCKRVDFNLCVTPATLTQQGSTLLSQLQAGGGKEPQPNSHLGAWKILSNRSIITLRSMTTRESRIALTLDGFIYFCPEGSMNLDWRYESYTSGFHATRLLDLAISKIRSEEFKTRVNSLRVRILMQ
jgi:hypothetical protein